MKRGIFVAPFGELAEPQLVAELAVQAEARGWDGFFLWDHFTYREPVRRLADPWVTMAAIAVRTERIVTGPLVTPVPRRRPHQLARETVTLDRLSGGRLIFGVGLGGNGTGEFDAARFGEEEDPKARAKLLDDGLETLVRYWEGEFEPTPLDRIPIWVASRYPKKTPLRRAARYDGWFPIDLPGPEALREQLDRIAEMRGGLEGYDVVVTNPAGSDHRAWADAGATWCLTGFGTDPSTAAVQAAIDGDLQQA